MSPHSVVIVGGGLAGARAAETLWREGFEGRVVLVGEEDERPYDRPPLSKGFLRGEDDMDKVYLHHAGFYDDRAIEVRTGSADSHRPQRRRRRAAHRRAAQLRPAAPRHRGHAAEVAGPWGRPRRHPLPPGRG